MLKKYSVYWLFGIPAIIFIIIFILQFSLLKQFHALPSEAYGGDQYLHMGRSLHWLQGKPFYESSHYVGEYEHYPWLTNAAVALFAAISGLSILKATIFFPLIASLLTFIMVFYLAYKLTPTTMPRIILSTLFAAVAATYYLPDAHPSEIAKFTMIPLIVLILYFSSSRTWQHIILPAFVLSIAALQHVVSYIFALTFFFLLLLVSWCSSKDFRSTSKHFFLVFILHLPIALLYWFPVIFFYHAKTLNSWQEWSTPSIYPSITIITKMLIPVFITLSSPLEIAMSVIIFLGIAIFLYNILRKQYYRSFHSFFAHIKETHLLLPMMMFLAFLIDVLHPYATKPLFGFTLGYYRFSTILFFTHYVLWYVLLLYMIRFFSLGQQRYRRWLSIALGIACCLVIVQYSFMLQQLAQTPRLQYALREDQLLIESYQAFASFAEKNAPEIFSSQVVISFEPFSLFYLNGVTGSKVFLTTRTHANPFVDYDQRSAELAVMLYGNDTTERHRLLAIYNITYFFSEKESFRFVAYCKQYFVEVQTKQFPKDHFKKARYCLQTSPQYADYLQQNNVTFLQRRLPFSIEKDAPTISVLLINPSTLQFKREILFSIPDNTSLSSLPYFMFARIGG